MSRSFDKLFDTIAQCRNVIMIFGEKVEQFLQELFIINHRLRCVHDVLIRTESGLRNGIYHKAGRVGCWFQHQAIRRWDDARSIWRRPPHTPCSKTYHLSWWQTRRRRSSSLSLTNARRPNTARNFHNQVLSISYWGTTCHCGKSTFPCLLLFIICLCITNSS